MATYRKLPSGNWQARVKIDGSYKTIGTFPTKKEAEIKAGEIERQVFYNETLTDRNMLFQEVINEWFNNKADNVKASTLEQLEVIKRLHIEPFFGHKKVFQISRANITDWIKHYEDMADKNGNSKYSYGARQRFLVTLKDIFSFAVLDLEVLNKNPSTKIKLPVRGEVTIKNDVKYYSLNELNILLDYLSEYEPQRFKEYKIYYVLVYLLSRTGLRISEALALKWSDIEGNRIGIDKQTSRNDNNELIITTLKTTSSYRNIEIDEDTIEMLAWFRRQQQKMVLKHKGFKRNPDMIVFQTYQGNYMTPSTVRDTLRSYCLNAGVEYKGTHVFRHSHAVLALESGADLVYISRRLGHGSIQTTADTYLDITAQYESSELTKITEHLNSEVARKWHDGVNQ